MFEQVRGWLAWLLSLTLPGARRAGPGRRRLLLDPLEVRLVPASDRVSPPGYDRAGLRRAARRVRHPGGRLPEVECLETRTLLTGSWSTVRALAPSQILNGGGIGEMMLLSDGRVLAIAGLDSAAPPVDDQVYALTPDSSGSYANGTWSTLTSMGDKRFIFPSNVLPDGGWVFVAGGEYTTDPNHSTNINRCEIYDPAANAWTGTQPFPESVLGATPSELLPDGRVLASSNTGGSTYIYNPINDTWSPGAAKLRGGAPYSEHSLEETWVKLPDGSVLVYDIFASNYAHDHGEGHGYAQRYVPSTNTWVDASAGAPDDLSTDQVAYGSNEIGPALLLPDGRVLQLGATGHTGLYTPSTNSWTSGPDLPANPHDPTRLLVSDDAPGAMMPNGKVLMTLEETHYGPTYVYEFDPTTLTYTNVTPPDSIIHCGDTGAGVDVDGQAERMLVLPTGQVLFSNGDFGTKPPAGVDPLAIYTPDGPPAPQPWRPTISSITPNGDGSFTLTGTQLNGISQGASYGDDAEMDTNYPLVRVHDQVNGNVYYAPTYNWSSTGVATGSSPESTQFRLPQQLGGHPYLLSVVANGIDSMAPAVVVNGTYGNDAITLRNQPGNPLMFQVFVNGLVQAAGFWASATSITINTLAGDDTVNIQDAVASVPVNVNLGNGTDVVYVAGQPVAGLGNNFTVVGSQIYQLQQGNLWRHDSAGWSVLDTGVQSYFFGPFAGSPTYLVDLTTAGVLKGSAGGGLAALDAGVSSFALGFWHNRYSLFDLTSAGLLRISLLGTGTDWAVLDDTGVTSFALGTLNTNSYLADLNTAGVLKGSVGNGWVTTDTGVTSFALGPWHNYNSLFDLTATGLLRISLLGTGTDWAVLDAGVTSFVLGYWNNNNYLIDLNSAGVLKSSVGNGWVTTDTGVTSFALGYWNYLYFLFDLTGAGNLQASYGTGWATLDTGVTSFAVGYWSNFYFLFDLTGAGNLQASYGAGWATLDTGVTSFALGHWDSNFYLIDVNSNGEIKRSVGTGWVSQDTGVRSFVVGKDSVVYELKQDGSVARFSLNTGAGLPNLVDGGVVSITLDNLGILSLLMQDGSVSRYNTLTDTWM
jgi:hypothetical protein